MDWIKALMQHNWCQYRGDICKMAANATGLAYNTYRHFKSGAKPVPAAESPPKEKQPRSDNKINIELMATIRRKITEWNRGVGCEDQDIKNKGKVLKRPPPVALPRIIKYLKGEHGTKI